MTPLDAVQEFAVLNRPVIVLAVSRKYVLGMITGRRPHERLGATLAAIGHGLDAGAHVVRVHHVGE